MKSKTSNPLKEGSTRANRRPDIGIYRDPPPPPPPRILKEGKQPPDESFDDFRARINQEEVIKVEPVMVSEGGIWIPRFLKRLFRRKPECNIQGGPISDGIDQGDYKILTWDKESGKWLHLAPVITYYAELHRSGFTFIWEGEQLKPVFGEVLLPFVLRDVESPPTAFTITHKDDGSITFMPPL